MPRYFMEQFPTREARHFPSRLYSEIDDEGWATREVGTDVRDMVVHRFPDSRFRLGKRGYGNDYRFDVNAPEVTEIDAGTFEVLWARSIPIRDSPLRRWLRRLMP